MKHINNFSFEKLKWKIIKGGAKTEYGVLVVAK
jgi:hypothetical protein